MAALGRNELLVTSMEDLKMEPEKKDLKMEPEKTDGLHVIGNMLKSFTSQLAAMPQVTIFLTCASRCLLS